MPPLENGVKFSISRGGDAGKKICVGAKTESWCKAQIEASGSLCSSCRDINTFTTYIRLSIVTAPNLLQRQFIFVFTYLYSVEKRGVIFECHTNTNANIKKFVQCRKRVGTTVTFLIPTYIYPTA